jgi:hypothetical protein
MLLIRIILTPPGIEEIVIWGTSLSVAQMRKFIMNGPSLRIYLYSLPGKIKGSELIKRTKGIPGLQDLNKFVSGNLNNPLPL